MVRLHKSDVTARWQWMQQYSLDSVWTRENEVVWKSWLWKVSTLFAELKMKFFPTSNGVERPIAKYSSLQHVLNVSFWK